MFVQMWGHHCDFWAAHPGDHGISRIRDLGTSSKQIVDQFCTQDGKDTERVRLTGPLGKNMGHQIHQMGIIFNNVGNIVERLVWGTTSIFIVLGKKVETQQFWGMWENFTRNTWGI